MTYVVNESCIKCKYMDCVEVCPVDCFYEGENMLVIHPDECIDCGVCEPECPVDAIKPDTEPGLEKWLEVNAEFAKTLPGGQRIAHGTMIFSIGVGLTATAVNPVAFSYGYDRLRFIRPVHIGDTIHTRVTITEKSNDPKHANVGRVIERCEVINQRGETVLAADHILIVQRNSAKDVTI